jgi:hypothetical protein
VPRKPIANPTPAFNSIHIFAAAAPNEEHTRRSFSGHESAMHRCLALLSAGMIASIIALPAAARAPAGFPPPKSLGPVESYGANLQRSMSLLATSTPLKRNTVRVLFYGQSISMQEWTLEIAADLRRRFPFADLVIENRAIGSYTADYLAKTAEADLYPFYPDLVIFHAYGSPAAYESIIRGIRERTTADVLHSSDHLSAALHDRIDEETDPRKLDVPGLDILKVPVLERGPWMNHVFLPRIAKTYETEFADVRGVWKQYLRDNKLAITDLLKSEQHQIHLNPRGCYLMGEIIKPHLRHRPELPDDRWADRVKTFTVGTDASWVNGKLTLPFDGNRVDLICGGGSGPPAPVRIDGKKPSEFPELYVPSRSYLIPRCYAPPILRVQAEKPRVIEDWVLTITEMSPDRTWFKYKVAGSVTGEDGEGDTRSRFVSKSGRVVLNPDDFHLTFTLALSRDPGAARVECRWSVVPLFRDEFVVPERRNPFGETAVTVAQGLSNGRHTLEISGSPDTPIAAIRVYRPPLGRK